MNIDNDNSILIYNIYIFLTHLFPAPNTVKRYSEVQKSIPMSHRAPQLYWVLPAAHFMLFYVRNTADVECFGSFPTNSKVVIYMPMIPEAGHHIRLTPLMLVEGLIMHRWSHWFQHTNRILSYSMHFRHFQTFNLRKLCGCCANVFGALQATTDSHHRCKLLESHSRQSLPCWPVHAWEQCIPWSLVALRGSWARHGDDRVPKRHICSLRLHTEAWIGDTHQRCSAEGVDLGLLRRWTQRCPQLQSDTHLLWLLACGILWVIWRLDGFCDMARHIMLATHCNVLQRLLGGTQPNCCGKSMWISVNQIDVIPSILFISADCKSIGYADPASGQTWT